MSSHNTRTMEQVKLYFGGDGVNLDGEKSVAEQALDLEKNRSSRERSVFLCPLYQMGNDEQSKQMLDPVNKWIEPLLLIQGVAMKMCYMNTNLTH